MPYQIYQTTYRQDYKVPNVDREHVAREYDAECTKADIEAEKKCVPPENLNVTEEKKCEPEWTKLERMELILHPKIFTDHNDEMAMKKKKKAAIDKPNKFTQKIDKDMCVSPVAYKRYPGEFRTTYQEDYADLDPYKTSPYDNLTTQMPLQYKEIGNIIVPEDSTIAEYIEKCLSNKKVFVSKNRNEISNALPSGKCLCAFTEYQDGIGNIGGILKKQRLDDLGKVKESKKGKRTCH